MARPVATILAIVIAASPLPTAAAAKDRRPDTLPHASPVVSAPKLPLAFEEREPAGLYTARAGGSEVAIRPASVAIAGGVRFELTGAARTARLAGADRLPGVANYLVGTDRTKWRTNVLTFGGVRAMAVWPGVDVAYRGDGGHVAWDFHLLTNADPRCIEVAVTGASSLAIDADGSLVARTTKGEVRQDAPIVYQETPSGCTPVEGRFELRGQNRYGFAIGRYDAARPLVIDPTIVYSLSFGTGGETFATGVAVDTQGNSYIVGNTRATDFPIVGGFDNSLSGFNDAFVTKVNANGTAFVYSTYLGGTNVDGAAAVAVDSTGAVYVTGATSRDSTWR